jgi:hypothetical protein
VTDALADQLRVLLLEIDDAHNPPMETECVAILSKWLTQRCEWRAIVHAERRKDIPTLERYATSAVNENIRHKAEEFLQNVRRDTLHNRGGGVLHNSVPEAANA